MKVFIAGARAISTLEEPVENRLRGLYNKNYSVLVGDANGVDVAVQRYFSKLNYSNVTVYASNGKARNNIGNWQVETVSVPSNIKGFDFYAVKDKAMADNADYGFMIWNGESRGTLNNIINLLNDNKKSLVYFTPDKILTQIDNFKDLEKMLNSCNDDAQKLYKKLRCKQKANNTVVQMSLFEINNDIVNL